jgi:hypothetical protein
MDGIMILPGDIVDISKLIGGDDSISDISIGPGKSKNISGKLRMEKDYALKMIKKSLHIKQETCKPFTPQIILANSKSIVYFRLTYRNNLE